MPVRSFSCPVHGEFRRVVAPQTAEQICPTCGSLCLVLNQPRVGVSIATPKLDTSPIYSEEALNERLSIQVREAWAMNEDNRRRRAAAEAELTEEQLADQEKNLELRAKLQEIIKSENPDDLEQAGIKVWRRTEELANRRASNQ